MTVTSEQFSGCAYFSKILVILSGTSLLSHRLLTISASCWVTLGPVFASSVRTALSSVSSSSLGTAAAPGSVGSVIFRPRRLFTSSSEDVTLIASRSSFDVRRLGDLSSESATKDALWRRLRPSGRP